MLRVWTNDDIASCIQKKQPASEGIRLSQLQFSARNKLQQADFDREFRSVLCLELVRIASAATVLRQSWRAFQAYRASKRGERGCV